MEVGAVLAVKTSVEGYVVIAWEWFRQRFEQNEVRLCAPPPPWVAQIRPMITFEPTSNHNLHLEVGFFNPFYGLLQLGIASLVGEISSMDENISWW